MTDVNNKTAFITGGASGIGLALARKLLARGAKVVIADVEAAVLPLVHSAVLPDDTRRGSLLAARV